MVSREVYMKNISKLIDHELIKVIMGVRRCGKSYMLNLIIEELIKRGVNKDNIVLINFDENKYNSIENTRELDLFIEEQVKNIKGKIYFLFDEIQNVDEWEKSITGYKISYDCDIYITGSNSKLLSGELATHLTGRYIEIKMHPFSYKEFLEYKNQESSQELFTEYLRYGGMPVVLTLDDDYKLKYMDDLFNSIFTKDILKRYNIKDYGVLLKLFMFILDNIGKDFSAQSIIEYLNKNKLKISRKTIYNYLKYLEEACLIYKVKREDVEGKEILKLKEKYYVIDHGFYNAMISNYSKNISRILENIVFIELLRRGYDIKIAKINDYEVDFICRKSDKTIYIQVTYYLSSDETYEREFRPLLAIPDNYPKYVISADNYDLSSSGIIHLNIIDFLNDYSLIE